MDDSNIYARINALVEEEHQLNAATDSTPETHERRQELEVQLDQCWDLLRQRQALREFGRDPDEAKPRPIDQVESYWE
jgi:Protein of unknown function (DUF2630)